ncbi:ARM repeat-containing protein [Coniochaeta sp. PMI_546]|nr:ARM repeat-containing protein [Coniochaeta sp. PMI_546]
MNFAVEVPGEAAPLSLQELVRALQAAQSSTNNAERQAAGQQLTEWYSHKDFLSSLQTIFLDKSIPQDIRYLAILHLKNGVDKYWRQSSSKNALLPQEKEFIRSRLFQGSVDEEHPPFVLHNALLVAKVVRIDYPQNWPDAVSTLTNIIRATSTGIQQQLLGALTVLLHVVKELSTARLRRSQTSLQSVTPELVQLLGEIYIEKTAYWVEFLTKGRGDEDDADLAMQDSLTALKILRRLLSAGYERPHSDTMVQQFWGISQTQFDQFLVYVRADSPIPFPYQDVVGKHLLQFTKLHIQMADSHPASFALLPNSLPLVRAYWGLVADFADVFEKSGGIKQTTSQGLDGPKSKMEGPLQERLALKGLLLLRSCIAIVFRPAQSFKYKSEEMKREEQEAVEFLRDNLLTSDFVIQVVNVIVTKLFIFRQSDLEAWEDNPEDWEVQERDQGEAWEWEVRPCSERVFLDLIIHYKDILAQPLLTYFDTVTKVESTIVEKEAIYTAMGCAAPTIHELFDFDSFLTSTLVRDAQIQDPYAKLLRRRIAILISQWVTVKINTANRTVVYDIFRHFMNPADKINDDVVRITAARQFKLVADDYEFSGDAFLPYASDMFTNLIDLLKETSNDETKLAILETMRVIVSRMDKHVSQFGDGIMSILPQLWDLAEGEEYMLKQSVLAITTALVMSMKEDSQKFQNLMVPLLREALNPESALHLHLLEESVELWKSILQMSSPPLVDELRSLASLALPLLQYDTNVSKECLEIVRDYIILSPQDLLNDDLRQSALRELAGTLNSKSREQLDGGTKSIELLIRQAEALGGAQGVSVVFQDMTEIHLIRKILSDLYNAFQSNQTVGPNKVSRRINTVVEKSYFAILARLALAEPAAFVDNLARFSNDAEFPQPWTWLLSEWFASFDYLADLERGKLSCLALTRLCELPGLVQELVLEKLQDFLSMWTSVRTELRYGMDTIDGDSLVRTSLALEPNEFETPIDVVERAIAAADPVHTINAHVFVNTTLQGLVQRAGGQQRFEQEWLVNIDKDVLAGFEALSKPPNLSSP